MEPDEAMITAIMNEMGRPGLLREFVRKVIGDYQRTCRWPVLALARDILMVYGKLLARESEEDGRGENHAGD